MNGLVEVLAQRRHPLVRPVEVTDPVAADRHHDYADAFEVRLAEPDRVPPAEWIRAGLSSTPAVVDKIAALLGHRSPPVPSPNVIEGFRVVQSTAAVVQLEYALPLFNVVLVGRQVKASTRTLTSLVTYTRPVLSRLVFAVIRPGHRWAARHVLTATAPPAAGGQERSGDV